MPTASGPVRMEFFQKLLGTSTLVYVYMHDLRGFADL